MVKIVKLIEMKEIKEMTDKIENERKEYGYYLLSSIDELIEYLDNFNAENIKPLIHQNYDGKDIFLKEGRVLSTSEFPSLKKHLGETLITADGTTLLGADDKAGIAGLLGMLKSLKENPDLDHGDIWVAFGPDKEIGKGAARFNVERFPVEFAYT